MNYEEMTAPCGIACFDCVTYLAKDDVELRAKVAKQFNMQPEDVVCKGCRANNGKCSVIRAKCRVYPCAESKGVKFCCDCTDFPCDLLHPYADKADSLPHNTKVFNLCLIKKMGLEKWATEKAKQVKNDYFHKKWEM
jgi:hypothetical protein